MSSQEQEKIIAQLEGTIQLLKLLYEKQETIIARQREIIEIEEKVLLDNGWLLYGSKDFPLRVIKKQTR